MGVPTYRFKLAALALSCGLAGLAGGIHGVFVSYVTVGETFSGWMALNVILMAALGGTRHWLGPAVGAAAVTALTYYFTASQYAVAGRAVIGLIFIVVILFMPNGLLGRIRGAQAARRARRSGHRVAGGGEASDEPLLVVKDARKAFKGVQALAGASLEVRRGEILGLVGPERLRQVDAHQRGERPLPDRRRQRAVRGTRAGRRGAAHRIARARHRAHLPDPAALRAPHRAGERRAAADVRPRDARSPQRASARRGAGSNSPGSRRRRTPSGGPQPPPAQVPRARARARIAAEAALPRRGAFRPDARRDRRGACASSARSATRARPSCSSST